ncbi:winged helix-turn-helix transcriptional regulator [Kitasatospora viridis]|uniref:HxlR family transcriptional regulator n=1 Tax=Kitasatospora viridis TaxID=281105 RepID=A0A561T706_9ACTN|nr:helix-turn-helix domain-containing protein [Kitasatospora viridis]TWF82895.1 HxlR family transcriptional regulator [Kitasatospora viridis]
MTTDQGFVADCRARLAFDLLANTWNAVVLWTLRGGPARPGELRGRIGGISPKVLTETLRRLQFNGLVERRAHPGSPPHVEYSLTVLGRTLLEPIEAFGLWAFEHGDDVLAAREQAETDGSQEHQLRAPGVGLSPDQTMSE